MQAARASSSEGSPKVSSTTAPRYPISSSASRIACQGRCPVPGVPGRIHWPARAGAGRPLYGWQRECPSPRYWRGTYQRKGAGRVTGLGDERQRLVYRVDHIRLEAVQRFHSREDPVVFRGPGGDAQVLQAPGPLLPLLLRRHDAGFAHGGIQGPSEQGLPVFSASRIHSRM